MYSKLGVKYRDAQNFSMRNSDQKAFYGKYDGVQGAEVL